MEILDTPVVTVDMERLEVNIAGMADFARGKGVNLRPHIKSHKTVEIALKQMAAGAVGITVSKLGEAEVMAEAGIGDIFIAYPLVGEQKIRRLMKLMEGARVSVAVDSREGAAMLSRAGEDSNCRIPVLMEVDSGLNRCGVLPGEEALNLAREVVKMPGLKLEGVFTHAGHVYGAGSPREVEEIGRQEGEAVLRTADLLRAGGIPVATVSTGSTPTARISGSMEGITEIRPGNYVFYDAIQVGLGVVPEEFCSLAVQATIISRPTGDRGVIDAGSKVFSLDKGAHGRETVRGFGMIPGWPHITLSRLSEEHGVFERVEAGKGGPMPAIGERLRVIPNHACTVVNLTDSLTLVEGDKVVGRWRVGARGRVD